MSDNANDLKNELKNELKKTLSHLQALRDEVRVRLHLANMELKDQWNKLEPHLADVEKKAADATEASRTLLHEAVKSLEKFRASL
jgi:predicted  nucleic acid-binding Zn-ribbon protein